MGSKHLNSSQTKGKINIDAYQIICTPISCESSKRYFVVLCSVLGGCNSLCIEGQGLENHA